MSSPLTSVFAQIEQMQYLFDPGELLEGRFENDGNDNPIYIGYSPIPNADPADPVWFIQKVTYDGEALIRKQQPDNGVQFAYVWNDRATYFS